MECITSDCVRPMCHAKGFCIVASYHAAIFEPVSVCIPCMRIRTNNAIEKRLRHTDGFNDVIFADVFLSVRPTFKQYLYLAQVSESVRTSQPDFESVRFMTTDYKKRPGGVRSAFTPGRKG